MTGERPRPFLREVLLVSTYSGHIFCYICGLIRRQTPRNTPTAQAPNRDACSSAVVNEEARQSQETSVFRPMLRTVTSPSLALRPAKREPKRSWSRYIDESRVRWGRELDESVEVSKEAPRKEHQVVSKIKICTDDLRVQASPLPRLLAPTSLFRGIMCPLSQCRPG